MLRDYEMQLILKWIGFNKSDVVTDQMLMDAILYAYDMGFTDGRAGD